MKAKLTGLIVGAGAGFAMSWARLSDPAVIRNMLLLRDPHVFLVMGSAIAVAAAGVRALKVAGVRAVITGEPIGWSVDRPRIRHISGSALFGAGWAVAGTCPGPAAAMIGEGRLGAMAVAAGLIAGIVLQRVWTERRAADMRAQQSLSAAI